MLTIYFWFSLSLSQIIACEKTYFFFILLLDPHFPGYLMDYCF